MDKHKLDELVTFVDFLKNIVGKNVEIVLHVIEKDTSYIAKIINGHVSGRDETAPLTDLAISLIDRKIYKDRKFIKNYTGYTQNNKKIQASTYFVTSAKGELEAMICFNIDVSKYEQLMTDIIDNMSINVEFLDSLMSKEKNEVSLDNIEFTEFYSNSLQDVVYNVIPKEVIDSKKKLKTKEKLYIIKAVYDKGLFNFKGTINQIAKILQCSTSSVYRYLAEVENKEVVNTDISN